MQASEWSAKRREVCVPCAPHRPQLAKGFMQLYSFEQAKSQALEAHAAAFASIKVRGVI